MFPSFFSLLFIHRPERPPQQFARKRLSREERIRLRRELIYIAFLKSNNAPLTFSEIKNGSKLSGLTLIFEMPVMAHQGILLMRFSKSGFVYQLNSELLDDEEENELVNENQDSSK